MVPASWATLLPDGPLQEVPSLRADIPSRSTPALPSCPLLAPVAFSSAMLRVAVTTMPMGITTTSQCHHLQRKQFSTRLSKWNVFTRPVHAAFHLRHGGQRTLGRFSQSAVL